MKVETEHLKLPLRTSGHVQMQRSVRDGFEKIDQAVNALQTGSSGAADPRIDALLADVADLKTRVASLETPTP